MAEPFHGGTRDVRKAVDRRGLPGWRDSEQDEATVTGADSSREVHAATVSVPGHTFVADFASRQTSRTASGHVREPSIGTASMPFAVCAFWLVMERSVLVGQGRIRFLQARFSNVTGTVFAGDRPLNLHTGIFRWPRRRIWACLVGASKELHNLVHVHGAAVEDLLNPNRSSLRHVNTDLECESHLARDSGDSIDRTSLKKYCSRRQLWFMKGDVRWSHVCRNFFELDAA
jgi:hypothetical protein